MYTVKITNKKIWDLIKNLEKPVVLESKEKSAVLISIDEWESIQETLYLYSIPRMKESIIKGMKEPLKNCSRKVKF
jgi:antitoxin YefM